MINPLETSPQEKISLELTPMGQLGSGRHLVGRIEYRVRVSASFQIFVLRMLLHSAGLRLGDFIF